MSETVELDRGHAETLEEAGASLFDDLASGRQWGCDRDESRENAQELGEALDALRGELDGVRQAAREREKTEELMDSL